MSLDPGLLSVVSVDVVALSYDHAARAVLVAAAPRTAEPFIGALALPGVVVRSGEPLRDAATRALAKLELRGGPSAQGQLETFDEPSRDPRGPSLSLARWAVYPEGAESSVVTWMPLADPEPLAFDHDRIVQRARALLAERLWRDLDFSRSLTGERFTATDAVAITAQLSGQEPHRANLNRDLGRIDELERDGVAATTGGRPPTCWRWR